MLGSESDEEAFPDFDEDIEMQEREQKVRKEQRAKVLGYIPINILDPDTKVLRRYPKLKDALKCPITRVFAVGINRISNTLHEVMTLTSMSTTLLDNLTLQHTQTWIQISDYLQKIKENISWNTHQIIVSVSRPRRKSTNMELLLKQQINPITVIEMVGPIEIPKEKDQEELIHGLISHIETLRSDDRALTQSVLDALETLPAGLEELWKACELLQILNPHIGRDLLMQIPEHKRKRCMIDVAENCQVICDVALDMFQHAMNSQWKSDSFSNDDVLNERSQDKALLNEDDTIAHLMHEKSILEDRLKSRASEEEKDIENMFDVWFENEFGKLKERWNNVYQRCVEEGLNDMRFMVNMVYRDREGFANGVCRGILGMNSERMVQKFVKGIERCRILWWLSSCVGLSEGDAKVVSELLENEELEDVGLLVEWCENEMRFDFRMIECELKKMGVEREGFLRRIAMEIELMNRCVGERGRGNASRRSQTSGRRVP